MFVSSPTKLETCLKHFYINFSFNLWYTDVAITYDDLGNGNSAPMV